MSRLGEYSELRRERHLGNIVCRTKFLTQHLTRKLPRARDLSKGGAGSMVGKGRDKTPSDLRFERGRGAVVVLEWVGGLFYTKKRPK